MKHDLQENKMIPRNGWKWRFSQISQKDMETSAMKKLLKQ